MRRALAVLVLLLVASGCAGRDFVRTPAESLALGKTTEAEIRQRHGSPYREGTVMKNGETVKTLVYAYAEGAASLAGGVVPARAQGFYFMNGVLVGHEFTSSFEQDKTDFDASKVQQIAKGQATEPSVIALLGKPQGAYRYPLIKDRAGRGLVYLYQQSRGTAFNMKVYNQLLVVALDEQGVVRDVEFSSSGER